MSITAILVVLAICWFMVLYVVLPLGVKSQGESGEVVPGTPASAPAGAVIKRKFIITTIVAVPIWGIICAIIMSGVISLADIESFHRFLGKPVDGIGE